jgi:hypothetical protein
MRGWRMHSFNERGMKFGKEIIVQQLLLDAYLQLRQKAISENFLAFVLTQLSSNYKIIGKNYLHKII